MVGSISLPAVHLEAFSISQVKNSGVPSASCKTPFKVALMVSTVTVQEADFVESRLEVAVITAVPTSTAFTLPLASTVATDSSEEVQVTVRSVAVQGRTEAVRLAVLPRIRPMLEAEISTLDTVVVGLLQSLAALLTGIIRQVSSVLKSPSLVMLPVSTLISYR